MIYRATPQFHRVRTNERLSGIAALHGVPFQDIVAANPHKELTRLESGEVVFASLADGEDIALTPYAGEPAALGALPPVGQATPSAPNVFMKRDANTYYRLLIGGRLGFEGQVPQYFAFEGKNYKLWDAVPGAQGLHIILGHGPASAMNISRLSYDYKPLPPGTPPLENIGNFWPGSDITAYVVVKPGVGNKIARAPASPY